jgi:hypothetical protein
MVFQAYMELFQNMRHRKEVSLMGFLVKKGNNCIYQYAKNTKMGGPDHSKLSFSKTYHLLPIKVNKKQ